jgi:hypothetical protein
VSISESAREPRETAEVDLHAKTAASKLFDLRLLIGGLFVFYGLILIVAGAVAGGAELRKAAGININLWMGIGMFVLGALFLLWRVTRPLQVRPEPAPESEQPELPPKLQRETRPRREPGRASEVTRAPVSSPGPDGRGPGDTV